MNEVSLDTLRTTVGENDAVICAGEVARVCTLKKSHIERIRRLPGRKLLARGNHDFDRKGRVAEPGSDQCAVAAVVASSSLIVTDLSPAPLPDNPVNVHAYVYNVPLLPGSQINVCVEHTGYRPFPRDGVRLAEDT